MIRIRRGLLGLLVGGLVALLLAFWCAKPLLYLETGAACGDVIIILGGENAGRVWRGLGLYKAGAAPRILLSGRGDNDLRRQRLFLAGVPSSVVNHEPESRNTRENAEFSVRWMRQAGCHRAIVVTSWWHSRRALACFRKFGPDLEFASVPCYHGISMEGKPSPGEAVSVLSEYLKILYYPVRHGIWSAGIQNGSPIR